MYLIIITLIALSHNTKKLISLNYSTAHSHSNSLNIKYIWLAKFILTLKIVIGISLLCLGAWITLFANSTPISQNPFYSGMIIIVSGLLGLYLLSFKRSRSKFKMNFFWFLKVREFLFFKFYLFLFESQISFKKLDSNPKFLMKMKLLKLIFFLDERIDYNYFVSIPHNTCINLRNTPLCQYQLRQQDMLS